MIIITGAGKGIGRALVEEFCAPATKSTLSPRLFLLSRSESDLNELAKICAQAGVTAQILRADISHPEDNTKIVESCLSSFGQIDCLINNAGVGKFGAFLELTLEDYDYVMQVNARGTFDLTQKVFRKMEACRLGHIVFVTSISAEKAFEQSAIYCMSKFAQKGLIEVLRLYGYRLGIRITNVMPGAVNTTMWDETSAEFRKLMIPPREVARAIIHAIQSPEVSSVEEIVIRPTSGDPSQ